MPHVWTLLGVLIARKKEEVVFIVSDGKECFHINNSNPAPPHLLVSGCLASQGCACRSSSSCFCFCWCFCLICKTSILAYQCYKEYAYGQTWPHPSELNCDIIGSDTDKLIISYLDKKLSIIEDVMIGDCRLVQFFVDCSSGPSV